MPDAPPVMSAVFPDLKTGWEGIWAMIEVMDALFLICVDCDGA